MKIKSQAEIKKTAEDLRKEGNVLVTTNGSFDILHIGHIRYLQEAKRQGYVLIVGLNSDVSVKKYKGPDRPIIPEKERVEMLAALECVDYVVLFDQPEIATPLIELVKPNVHVNGEEYGENCVEAPAVKKVGARLHLIKRIGDFSTTNFIKKFCKIKR